MAAEGSSVICMASSMAAEGSSVICMASSMAAEGSSVICMASAEPPAIPDSAGAGSEPQPLAMSTAFELGDTQAIEPSAFRIMDSSPARHAESCCAAASGTAAAPRMARAASDAAAAAKETTATAPAARARLRRAGNPAILIAPEFNTGAA